VMEAETAFGHVAAKYALDLLTEDLMGQMVECTLPGVDMAVLEKGLKGYQRKKIEVALKKLGVETRQK
jgi:D-tyrosyl-tRNA(Tyr) deacylase